MTDKYRTTLADERLENEDITRIDCELLWAESNTCSTENVLDALEKHFTASQH